MPSRRMNVDRCSRKHKRRSNGKEKSREKSLTDEVLSLPVVGTTVDGDVETYVAFVLEERLHADRAVPIDHRTHHYLVLEAALDLLRLVEARSRDVDDGPTQHVTALRGENQRQMSTSCVRASSISVTHRMKVRTPI